MLQKLLFFLLTLSVITAHPAKDVWRKMETVKNNPDYEKQDLIVLLDSTHVVIHESGSSKKYKTEIFYLNQPLSYDKLKTVKYQYDPLTGNVQIKKALIFRQDHTIDTLSSERIYDYFQPARAIYWGMREIMIEPGLIKENEALLIQSFREGFSYALLKEDEDRFAPPMRGHFYDIIEFWSQNSTLKKVYQVVTPKDKPLDYQFFNGEASCQCFHRENDIIYHFSRSNIKPFNKEPDMTAFSDAAPKLLMTTTRKWEEKSRWFYQVNEDFGSFQWNDEIKSKVDELLKDAGNEEDSLWILNHWVAHEIRYSGISMGEGEGYTLHKGTEIFRDKIGVCKDKAGMLITMLRAAGFESYAAMTMAGSKIEDIPVDQFNHSVTVVKSRRTGKYRLLDPTWVPFVREQWSSAEQQQNYLMGVPEGADLMETPISPPEKHYLIITGETFLQETGGVKGFFTLEAEGQSDARFRRYLNYQPIEKREDFIVKNLLDIDPLINIKRLQYQNPYDISKPMKIEIEYEIPQYATKDGQSILMKPVIASFPFSQSNVNYFLKFNTELKNRKYPFRIRCSKQVILKETIHLPAETLKAELPAPQSIKHQPADYSTEWVQKGNKIEISTELNLNKRVYGPGEYEEFKAALDAFKQDIKTQIYIKGDK